VLEGILGSKENVGRVGSEELHSFCSSKNGTTITEPGKNKHGLDDGWSSET
jgi:hypothetical protein